MIEHHRSIFEIMLPKVVDFIIFAVVIGWVLKKQMTKYFNNMHDEIRNYYETTLNKIREAEQTLSQQVRKLENVENDVRQIEQDTQKSFEYFEARYAENMTKRIEKAKVDALMRFEAEKVHNVIELNEVIVNAMIDKSKAIIKKDQDLQKRVSEKMLEGVKQ